MNTFFIISQIMHLKFKLNTFAFQLKMFYVDVKLKRMNIIRVYSAKIEILFKSWFVDCMKFFKNSKIKGEHFVGAFFYSLRTRLRVSHLIYLTCFLA